MTPERSGATQRDSAEHTSLLEGQSVFRLERGSVRANDVRNLELWSLTHTGVNRHGLPALGWKQVQQVGCAGDESRGNTAVSRRRMDAGMTQYHLDCPQFDTHLQQCEAKQWRSMCGLTFFWIRA